MYLADTIESVAETATTVLFLLLLELLMGPALTPMRRRAPASVASAIAPVGART